MDDEQVSDVFLHSCAKEIGFDSFKAEQLTAIKAFVSGHDVFLSLCDDEVDTASGEYEVSIKHSSSESKETLLVDNIEDSHFASVISELTSQRITTVSQHIEGLLSSVKEAIVAYIEPDSNYYLLFQKAILSPILPECFKVFQTADKAFLPNDARSLIQHGLHVWVVTNGEWSHLALPHNDKNEIVNCLVRIFKKMQYSLKVTYESDQVYSVYKQEGFNLFTVYHHTDQLDTVYKTIIDPLVNIFRPYFVFITYDIDRHPVPHDVSGSFPYIVVLKHGQETRVRINNIQYTFKYLKSTLESLMEQPLSPLATDASHTARSNGSPVVDPAVSEDRPRGIEIARVNVSLLESIRESTRVPLLAVLCERSSFDCDAMEMKVNRAVEVIHKLRESYEIAFYVVECQSEVDVPSVNVPRLPYIIIKNTSSHQWSLYSETYLDDFFVRAIQTHGRLLQVDDDSEYRWSGSFDEYYDSFPELQEDDPVGRNFPEYLVIPYTLPILTTENYTNFINQNKDCLIAFYLPYCFSCKLAIYHLMNTTQELNKECMPPAIVNCANYPDVCEVFEVYQYPTIKYRRGYDSLWIPYRGILSNTELVGLVHNKRPGNEEKKNQNGLLEMTPSLLLNILKNDGLTTLLVLIAEDVTPELEGVFSPVTDYTVYWLNSTQYGKLSEFFIGLHLLDPPVLVWADYVEHSLYRLDLKKSPIWERVSSFINNVVNGSMEPDDEIVPSNWRPHSSPLVFPSARFLSQDRGEAGGYESTNRDDEDVDSPDEEWSQLSEEERSRGHSDDNN